MSNKVRLEEHMRIPLSDGTRLSARIWFPKGSEPCPAILEYHPYPKRYATTKRDEIAHGYFAEQGYVSLRVDMRGSGDSDGVLSDEYTRQERSDAVEVIDWISRQPWCSGAVGMYGLSWGGFNSLQLAAIGPPALKAVAAAGVTDDRYREDVHFMGGVMASEHIGWAATLLSFLARPPDPEIVGRGWLRLWRQRLDALEWVLPEWLAHPTRDDFWMDGFPCAAPEGLRVPTLVAGGTADVFGTSVMRMVARQPDLVKGIVGPWAHKFPHMGIPGPAIDWMHQCTRWFDRWLKGVPNKADRDPPLRIFVSDPFMPDEKSEGAKPGRWLALPSFPKGAQDVRRMALSREGRLGGAASSGRIALQSPQNLGCDGGEIMPMGWGADLPGDQRCDDARSLCFETEPLKSTVVVVGQPALTLRVAKTGGEAFCVARLCDVAPNGDSSRIAIGAQNLALDADFRALPENRAGKSERVTLNLGVAAHRFEKGHRIRLALSNSYWPMLWPSNNAEPLVVHLKGAALSLPLAPADAVSWRKFAAADGCPPLPRRALAPSSFERFIRRDIARGLTEFTIKDRATHERVDSDGLETLGETTRTYILEDENPAAAEMRISRKIQVQRGNWKTSSDVEMHFTGTNESYIWDVKLTARNGRRIVTEKRYRGELPRKA